MFTFDDLEARVREIIAADPDHIYQGVPAAVPGDTPRCYYVANADAESCIFGRALLSLGVTEDLLGEYEGGPVFQILGRLDVHYRASQDEWMALLQSSQDCGEPWGEALAIADAERPLH
jgi:hypothetical protein